MSDLFELANGLYTATGTDWLLQSNTVVTEPVVVSVVLFPEVYNLQLKTFYADGNTYEEAARDVILQARKEYVDNGNKNTQ